MWIHGGESRDQVVAEFCRNHSIGLKQFDFRTLNHTYMESNETVDENLVDRRSASLDLVNTYCPSIMFVDQ